MRNDFFEAYSKRLNEEYRGHFEKKYREFISKIQREIDDGAEWVAEFGCGAGNTSRVLSGSFSRILVDIDSRMLSLAQKNMTDKKHRCFFTMEGDILNPVQLPRFDVIHSHGVLEHFNDEEIKKIIALQKKSCQRLIHYVPSSKYEKPSFGDERLLSPKAWQDICSPDRITEFNDGLDLILEWGKLWPKHSER